jgi:ADP-ribose pyrophosphatase YjhB (NUDIX family)
MPTPDFILELRSMIGTFPLWLPGVTALVTDEQGRVLLGQRSDSRRWALPSGIPEPGEEMAAACAREVREETCVEVEVQELISIRTVPPVIYPNGDVTSYVDHFFRCRATGGRAQVGDDESLAVGWFELGNLPQPTTARTPGMLELAAQQAGSGRTHFVRHAAPGLPPTPGAALEPPSSAECGADG